MSRKEMVLEVIVELYAEYGDSFSFAQVGERSGFVNSSGPVHYFADKKQMKREAVEFAINRPDHPSANRVLVRAAMDDTLLPLIPRDRLQESLVEFARRIA